MLTMNQISIALQHARLKKIQEDTGVSVFFLKKLKNKDDTVPYSKMKQVSDFFEGVQEGE